MARADRSVTLVPTGATWRYFKGHQEASSPDPAAWRFGSFDDAGWLSGPATFWYGDVFTGTPITDMQNSYTTLFFRTQFSLKNPATLAAQLLLRAQCDDGFIVWLNGVEVARSNVPDGEPRYDSTALSAVSPDPAIFNDYPLNNAARLLTAGTNTLAVMVFNVGLGSSDIVFDAALTGTVDDSPPLVARLIPTNGAVVRALNALEVQFDEAVTGVDASDLLINGTSATAVSEVSPGQFVFTLPVLSAGPISVAFRPSHGIADLNGNAFGGATWGYVIDTNTPLPGLQINEFLAKNDRGIRDEDGDHSDWIEIFNSSSSPVSLRNWSLTDDTSRPARWLFPDKTLPAGGYLVVFASGKDRTNTAGRLHTNFKLPTEGGQLALVAPTGDFVTVFAPTYPKQLPDVSYGRANGATNVLGYFVTPTPGAPNSLSGPGFASGIAATPASRAFITPFNVSLDLTATATNGVIHYTLDGSVPTELSPAYSSPLTVSATTRLCARAFAPGLLPGPTLTEFYPRLDATMANFTSDLPVIVVNDFAAGRPPGFGKVPAFFQVYEPVNGLTSLTNPPTLTTRMGVGARGSSTEGLPKVSLSLEFRDDFDNSRNLSLLGLPAESDWVLYAPNSFEPVMIHNPFMHQLSRDLGRYSSRTRFVELYLVTAATNTPVGTATYNGIYVLEERIKQGQDRVDVAKLEPENTTAPTVTGGYLLKIDRPGPGESGIGAANTGIILVDPSEAVLRQPDRTAQWNYLQNYLNQFGGALYGANWKNPTNGYAAFVDGDSWIDHHLLNVVSFNVDALRLSAYFYKPREGKLHFGPLWDFDRTLGSTDGRDSNPRIWASSPNGTDFFNETTQAWWGRLFQDLEFYQRYVDRYQTLRRQELATTNLWRLVGELSAQLVKAQPRERNRWGTGYRTASGSGGGNYATEVQWMKNWLSNRVSFMDSQFVSRTALITPAGRFTNSLDITLTVPVNTTVYYTLDGSDPRLPGGAVAPAAKAYTGPFTLTANARVVARANNPAFTARTGANNPPLVSKWSAPSAATYHNTAPPLLLTEIMFHPSAPPIGSTNSASDFEYLEFLNTGTQPLKLIGFQLSGGVQFTFTATNAVTNLPPGERILLVGNRAAFLARYPGALGIAGEFTGRLGNGNNRIILTGPFAEPVSDLTYADTWAPLADGHGFSLVLREETVTAPEQLGNSAHWRNSTLLGGSPGVDDPTPPVFQPVVINEVLTRSDAAPADAIELFNAGTAEQSLAGWWLTDDFRAPRKYRIPAGTALTAGAFAVIDESQFRPGPDGFALGSQGDEVHLFSADATGELTGYHHGFGFGAAFDGVSFGRLVTRDNREHFVAQTRRTLGEANAGAIVGPLVITELHPEPFPTGGTNNTSDEFIEVRNVSTATLALFDSAQPTNTWHLRGGVSFDFATNATLVPGGFGLLVGFDPTLNAAQLGAFRARFNPPTDVPIWGPWSGTLNNAGETLRLLQPDATALLSAGQSVPHVLVEQVEYLSSAAWPTQAAGTGNSLQRTASRRFGDEPANWFAAPPTAGRPNTADEAFLVVLPLEVFLGPNGRLTLRFLAQPGVAYAVQTREEIDAATWQNVQFFPPTAVATLHEFSDAATATRRYFRITTP